MIRHGRERGAEPYAEAVHWFRIAADQGYAGAQCNRSFYIGGEGVTRGPCTPLQGMTPCAFAKTSFFKLHPALFRVIPFLHWGSFDPFGQDISRGKVRAFVNNGGPAH